MPVIISVHRTTGSLCCRTPYSPEDPLGILGGTGPADSAQRDCCWRQTEPNHPGLLGEQQAGGKENREPTLDQHRNTQKPQRRAAQLREGQVGKKGEFVFK